MSNVAKVLISSRRPPEDTTSVAGHIRKNYFGTPFNAIVSTICIIAFVWVSWLLIKWAFIDALWTGTPEDCRINNGACWPFVATKIRFFLFGYFPFEDHWRPASAVGLMLSMTALSMLPFMWRKELFYGWIVALIAMFILMSGGVFGLEPVSTSKWGGLPLTIMLSFVGIAAGFPFGVLLALGRRSKLPAIRTISITYIELIRGVPLISLLFMASVMFPLFLPDGMTINQVLRAQVAVIMFAAAYIAEVVRGGLQAIDDGQYEAAKALGLSYWQSMRLIILPQSLKIVIPPLVMVFIGFFQDTTLVTIIGLFDFLNTIRGAMRDPNWQGIAVLEGYAFAAVVYLVFSYIMGAYSRYLERRLKTSHD